MSKWIGYAVSVSCGEPLGCYQGTILEADGNTITLTKPFRNGFPYPKSQVTLNAGDIKELRIIEAACAASSEPHSTVPVPHKAARKHQKATVCENLQANHSHSGIKQGSGSVVAGGARGQGKAVSGPGPGPGAGLVPSKPIDIQAQRPSKNGTHTHSGSVGSGGKSRGQQWGPSAARRRDEACFGQSAEPACADFDFEGNLALFDKQALFHQMNSQKPDLVRQTESSGKYRHDENILGPRAEAPGPRRAILAAGAVRGALSYVTDGALGVPSLTARARAQLWDHMHRYGFAESAYTLLSRAACDVALTLVGGGRRLDERNAHQLPAAAVLGGGAAALTCARLLSAHGVRVTCHMVQEVGGECPRRALAAHGIAAADAPRHLPRADVVLLALPPYRRGGGAGGAGGGEGEEESAAVSAAVSWAASCRAPVVCIEPPCDGWGGAVGGEGVTCRAAVVGLLPPPLPPSLGRVHLVNVAPPPALFADLGVTYHPPFGAASVIALHPADE